MTTLDLAVLLAIRQAVAAERERTITLGVVTSRTLDSNIMVTMEGSTSSVPCKIGGDVEAYEGDRVVLVKASPRWWVVVASLTKRWPARTGVTTVQSSGTTTSSSFNDPPVTADVTFTKRWDTTRLFVHVAAGSYCSAVPCEAAWGVRLTPAAGASTTHEIINTPYYVGAERSVVSGWDFLSGKAAGTYTARAQWRRKSGSGTVTTDSFESIALNVEEVSP